MPTARELLEQADALMRRNRGREPEPDIPELTDEVDVAVSARDARPAQPAPLAHDDTVDEVPELTDAVARIEEVSIEAVPDEGDESLWLESQLGGASITGPAPDSIAVVPPATLRSEPPPSEEPSPARLPGHSDERKLAPETAAPGDAAFDAMLGLRPAETELAPGTVPDLDSELEPELGPELEWEPEREPESTPSALSEAVEVPGEDMAGEPDTAFAPSPEPSAVAAAPAPSDEEAPPPIPSAPSAPSWEAVAEEIRMQVLQRIDIFTDTGLQGELAARLQPVVDRASADLVATINREVGQLLRAYVAEAIEREIAKWRESNP